MFTLSCIVLYHKGCVHTSMDMSMDICMDLSMNISMHINGYIHLLTTSRWKNATCKSLARAKSKDFVSQSGILGFIPLKWLARVFFFTSKWSASGQQVVTSWPRAGESHLLTTCWPLSGKKNSCWPRADHLLMKKPLADHLLVKRSHSPATCNG